MSVSKVCPAIDGCQIYLYFHQNVMRDCMRDFCLGTFDNCARWALKSSAREVPATLLPTGATMTVEQQQDIQRTVERATTGVRTVL